MALSITTGSLVGTMIPVIMVTGFVIMAAIRKPDKLFKKRPKKIQTFTIARLCKTE
jgi:hypothetical protein